MVYLSDFLYEYLYGDGSGSDGVGVGFVCFGSMLRVVVGELGWVGGCACGCGRTRTNSRSANNNPHSLYAYLHRVEPVWYL